MKFQVPQFIEMEDKIFGPLSFKEFVYLVGACGLSYILYRYIPSFFVALIFIIPVMGFGAALAFYKVNNKPFIEVLQYAFMYFVGNKLYIWKKEKKPVPTREVDVSEKSGVTLDVPTLQKSKLTSLSWDLDVKKKQE